MAAPPSVPLRPGRDPGLDAARAVAVLAMVVGHTLDALLSAAARTGEGMQLYWSARGLTAPTFLFVAGWAVAISVERKRLGGLDLVRRYARRVGLLLLLGSVVRLPLWATRAWLGGDRALWTYFLGWDALHCVAGSLALTCGLLALTRRRAARLALLALAGVLLTLLSERAHAFAAGLPLGLAQALGAAPSAFGLFPWSAYFLAGAFGATALAARPSLRASHALMAAGLGTTAVLLWAGVSPWVDDAHLVPFRLALLASAVGAAMALPRPLAERLGPVGRGSLWVYLVHLPLVYGWNWLPGLAGWVGPRLSTSQALLTAAGVLAVSLTAALWLRARYQALRRGVPARAAPAASARPSAVPVSPGA